MYWVNGLYTITVNGVPTFQAANPGAGIPNGTQITAQWLADVQGELLAFLTKVGVNPAQNTPNQVLNSILEMYSAPPVYVINPNNNGTYIQNVLVPSWATGCFEEIWAGGGSGGVGSTSAARGGGGGEGGYISGFEVVVPGQTKTITVGAGGAGVSSGTGNPGGASSTGGGATATPGQGGGGNGQFGGGFGGNGAINAGVFTGVVFGGQDGSDGNSGAALPGGNGGGRGGRGSSAVGRAGQGFAGGSGGTTGGNASQAGAPGLVILRFVP